jgi:ketopantoate reductase
MSAEMMRIAIFSVGGVGGYFRWGFAQCQEEVVFIAGGENLRCFNNKGLIAYTPDGKSWVSPVQETDDTQAM